MGVENGLTIYSREDKHRDKNDFPENLCKPNKIFGFFLVLKVFDERKKQGERGTYGVRNMFMK